MSGQRARALGGLLLLAVLCTGLGYLLGRRAAEPPARGSTPWLETVSRELHLRPDQVAAIDRLLAEEDADLTALAEQARGELARPVAARRQRTEDEMLALLDEQQRQTYEQLTRP
jgi:hypothetical protein